MKNPGKIIGRIIMCLVVVASAIIFLYTLTLSFKAYSPLHGIAKSPFVGFKNFSAIISSPYITRIVFNTVIIGLSGLIIGALYVFASVLAIGSIKNNILKIVTTAILVLPAIIPVNLLVAFLPTEFLVKPSLILQVFAGAISGLKLASLVVIGGIFVSENVFCGALRCSFVFVGISLIYLFVSDTSFLNDLYNPATYEVLDTLQTFTYRKGLMEGNFSYSTAQYVIRIIFQAVPSAIGCAVLVKCRHIKKSIKTNSNNFIPFLAVAILPILMIFVIISGSLDLSGIVNLFNGPFLFNGFLIALFSALLVSGISVFIANGNLGMPGIIILSILCAISGNITGSYIVIKSIGLANTFLGVILNNLSIIPVISIVFATVIKQDETAKNIVPSFIIGFGLMFAHFWCDPLSATVLLNQRNAFPISLVMRQLVTQMAYPLQNEAVNNVMSTMGILPYILIPVIIATIGIAIGIMMKNKQLKEERKLHLGYDENDF